MVSELSILIPIYNHDVTALVHTLLAQCKRLPLTYEIRLYDDASSEQFRSINRPLSEIEHVVYQELPENIGRAVIRNLLAEQAAYKHLLLLDNDCLPVSYNYLYNYLKETAQHDVIVGGVNYVAEVPRRDYRLHWKYGKKRGSRQAEARQEKPYNDIFLCNALISKSVFLNFPLRQSLKRYGHEDTVFAHELSQHQIRVKHIQNPVVHLGLEKAPVMLQKTEQAVQNLVQLYEEGNTLHSIRLIKAYSMLRGLGLHQAFTVIFSSIERIVQQNLCSAYPSLFLFDLYRLYLLSKLMK
ncbi:glycosyltransferase [Pontibacter sp. E15-1]|uniref:glycosyltransferase n=1 Tax=Pontibacter sp. E15-1 TaxID=2919918 RepID=UPI001F4FBC99|nr:glycosyltransferase [Pontibacter sp. E15-1]MCJ8166363.1 glycosyltransferase [Pontibacter sp. E15-1]